MREKGALKSHSTIFPARGAGTLPAFPPFPSSISPRRVWHEISRGNYQRAADPSRSRRLDRHWALQLTTSRFPSGVFDSPARPIANLQNSKFTTKCECGIERRRVCSASKEWKTGTMRSVNGGIKGYLVGPRQIWWQINFKSSLLCFLHFSLPRAERAHYWALYTSVDKRAQYTNKREGTTFAEFFECRFSLCPR